MNKIYKLVYSTVRGCYVVASEFAKARGKSKSLIVGTLAAGSVALQLGLGGVALAQTVTTDTAATNANNASANQAVNLENQKDTTAQGTDAYATYDSEGNLIVGKDNEVVKIQKDTKAGYTRVENQPENVVLGTRNGVGSFTHATDTVKPVDGNATYSYEDIDTKWITTQVYNPETKQYEEKQIKVYSLMPGQYMNDEHNVRAKYPERAYYSSDADYNKAVDVYNSVATYIGTDQTSQSYYVSGATAIGVDNIAEGNQSTAIGNKAKVLNSVSTYYVDRYGKLTSEKDNAGYWLDDNGNITTTRSGYYASDGTFVDRYLMVPRLMDSSNAVAVGSDVLAMGRSAVAIGHDTHSKEYSVAIGEADNTDYSAVAVGNTNRAQYHSVAVGNKNSADGYYSLAQGEANAVTGDYSSAIGYTNTVNGEKDNTGRTRKATQSHAFGANNTVQGDYNLAAGNSNTISGDYAVALGNNNEISGKNTSGDEGDYAVAVGYNNQAEKNAVVIGQGSQAHHDGSIAIGKNVNAHIDNNNNATDSIAIGTDSKVVTKDSIAFGHGAAIGNNMDVATSGSGSTVAVGTSTYASAAYDVAIGAQAQTASSTSSNSGGSAISIGYKATVNDGGQRSIAMGANSSVALNLHDAVALGSQSRATRDKNTSGGYNAAKGSDSYTDGTSTWNSTLAAVSVGADSYWDGTKNTDKQTRQITNVAAGKNDTDAVNVAQLKQVGFTVTANSDATTGSSIKTGDTLDFKAEDNAIVSTAKDSRTITVKVSKTPTFTSVTTGDTVVNNTGLTVNNKTYVTKDGLNANNQVITNVADGKADGDAVNVFQLKGSRTTVKSSDNSIKVEDTASGNPNHAYDIKVDYDKVAENTSISYKANGKNPQTVTLKNGLDFSDGTNTTAEVGANGVVKFSVADSTFKDKAREAVVVEAGDNVTVTPTEDATNHKTTYTVSAADMRVKSGTATYKDDGTGSITLTNKDGSQATVSGLKDTYTKSASYDADKKTATFTRNDNSTYDLDLSAIANEAGNVKLKFQGENTDAAISRGNNDTLHIVGDGANITTTGDATKNEIKVALKDNLVLGKDGKDGKDGSIGLVGKNGTDGTVTTIIRTVGKNGTDGKNGTPGVNGTDGITRIVYNDGKDGKDGKDYTVATTEDGQKYAGDNYVAVTDTTAEQNVIAKKLNERLDIKGGATGELSNGNIGVNAADGVLKVQLAKDLTDLNSVTTGDTVINNTGLTVNNKTYVTKDGLNANNQVITNVADGKADGDAVNVFQLKGSRTTVKSSDNSIKVEDTASGNPNHAYDIKVDYDKVAENTSISYKANGKNPQTVTLKNGLDFSDGTNTTAEVGANGVVKFSVADSTFKDKAREAVVVEAGDNVTVTPTEDATNHKTTYTVSAADMRVKSGTATYKDDGTGSITLTNKDGSQATVTGLKDTYTKSASYDADKKTATFTRNDNSTYDLDLSAFGTLDDGLKFKGDDDTVIAKKLNEQLDIVGGADKANLTDKNIGVNSVDGKLKVQLAKDLKDLNSVTTGDTVINTKGLTITKDATDETKNVVINGDKVSFGGNQVNNMGSGLGNTYTDAGDNNGANIGDVKNIADARKTTVKSTDGTVKVENKSTDANHYDYDLSVDYSKAAGAVDLKYTGDNGTKGSNKLSEAVAFNGTANQIVTTAANGSVTFKLADDLKTQTVTVTGKDGNDGQIGLTGKDGKDGTVTTIIRTVGKNGTDGTNGTPGVDGKDGITRIVYNDGKDGKDGKDYTVATTEDGQKYAGDNYVAATDTAVEQNVIAKKLNERLDIKGGANKDNLTENNIGVNVVDGALKVQLAKDLKGLNTVAAGTDSVFGKQEVTNNKGDKENGGYVTGLDNLTWNGDTYVSGRAATEDQLFAVYGKASQHTVVQVNNGTAAPDTKGTYSTGGNLQIKETVDDNGKATYDIKMSDNLSVGKAGQDGKDGSIAVNGQNGSGVTLNGKDGSIGLKGENGANGLTIKGQQGAAGVKGQDGAQETRIVYNDGQKDHTVATTEDGLKFKGDDGQTITKALNETLDVVGGVTDTNKLTDHNIGVVNDGGKLTVKLSKDIDLGHDGSIQAGSTTINADGVSTNQVKVGDKTTIDNGSATIGKVNVNGNGENDGNDQHTSTITGLSNTTFDTTNVDQYTKSDRAATEGQLKDVYDLASKHSTVTVNGGAAGNLSLKPTQNENGSTNYDISLNDKITLGSGDENKKVTIDGNQGEIKTGDISIAGGDTDTISGLKNTTFDVTAAGDGKKGSSTAATEGQLQDVVDAGFALKDDKGQTVQQKLGQAIEIKDKDGNIITTADNTGKGLNLSLSNNLNIGGAGKDGKDGTNGHMGINGADGKSGVGIDGKDGISVKGADGKAGVTITGKDGANGTEGHIGLTGAAGKDGKNATADIHVVSGQVGVDGTDGNGGKDGMDRITYTDHNDKPHEVATTDDGLKFAGDSGDALQQKLNSTTNIKGGADTTKLTDGNIGVVSDGKDTLTVKLAKEIKGLDSVEATTVNATTVNSTTVNSRSFNIAGDSTHNAITIKQGDVNMGGNTVSGVAPGKVSADSTEAINGSQLYARDQAIGKLGNSVNRLDNKINRAGAGAAALAALHPQDFDPDDKWDFAAGYGNYHGASAAAIGAFYRPTEDVMVSVGGSMGGGENMVNAGVTFKLGQHNHVSNSRVAMAKEIRDLKAMLLQQNGEMQQMKQLVNQLAGKNVMSVDTSALFPDIPQNHWAYEYVTKLAHTGILKGYPDGEFKGDRMMTRYEFATMLYRAIMGGAASNPELNKDGTLDKLTKEFEPELKYIRIDTISRDSKGNPSIERVRVVKQK